MKPPLFFAMAALFGFGLFGLPVGLCAQTLDAPSAVEMDAAKSAAKADTPAPAEPAMTAPANGYYANSEAAMAFADRIAEKDQIDRDWLRATIGQARFSAAAQRLMRPSQGAFFKNWRTYRSRFVEPIRINAGVRFWRANRETLERAEREFGVPVEVILGILGVETIDGRDMGNFRVMDSLATLAFDFPKTPGRDRSAFFQNELEVFLVHAYRAGQDPFEARGSYAGAMGMGQFMPSSIAQFAVDYDGDGVIDLAHSPADAIGSVANYFKSYGWQPGKVALFDVKLDPAKVNLGVLLAPDILPSFRPEQLTAAGLELPQAAQDYKGLLALIELWNGDPAVAGNEKQYFLGTDNFYAITRYNQSSYYAMAVLDLGAAIRERAGF